MDKDVTDLVKFDLNDGEYLPLTKCVCGATSSPWEFSVGIYPEDTHTCEICQRELYFTLSIRVFEKVKE